jgi:hypothetical protein
MKWEKTSAIFLIVLGVVLLIVSLFADLIGIGTDPKFGYKQIIGVILGAAAGIRGLLLLRKR